MFNLKPEEVTFERIESFCKEQIPEGQTIEYKGDFPSNLEKSISAMANTYGGIILVGVEADQKTNTPILPIKGREFSKGLEEKVTSVCLRKIHHPYFPWVKVCPFKNDKQQDRCVVFIRVYESDQTPHAINNNTDVYLRIRSQNEPFRKATVDEIEWLKDKRKKAIELRETILARALERYDTLSAGFLDELRRQRFRMTFVVPLYCSGQIVSRYELYERLLAELRGHGLELQAKNLDRIGKTGSDALYYFEAAKGDCGDKEHVRYGEFSTHGLVLRRESLWEDIFPVFYGKFDIVSLLQQIYETLKIGLLFCSGVGYSGMVRVGVDVQGFRNRELVRVDESSQTIEESIVPNEVENRFSFSRDFLLVELEEKLDSLIVEIYEQFLFTCGLGKYKNRLEQLAMKHYDFVNKRYQTQI